MPFDFFIAANVFFLSFISEITVSTIAMIQNIIVNRSMLALLDLIYIDYNDKIIKKVLPMKHLGRKTVKNDMVAIKQLDLLKSIKAEEIELLLHEGSFQTAEYAKNGIVHFVGEVCSKLEIILSGKVVIERIDESGNLMTIAEFFSGDVLGGNLMFSKNPHYPMTVTAKQPTVILEIHKTRLFQLFSDHHDFLKSYLEYVADHTAILGDRIKHYVNTTIRQSILSYLDYERKKQNDPIIKLSITKKALAEKIGVQRTSLSRELAKMRDDGLIRFDNHSIELL
ncbi:MAG: Crp/Fnr family transcriptional regulator [Epsilonproteobacteria bacterium]|nr:Crp/Fnr family transcriptional regulator [Campylobacterota bacterium]